MQLKLRAEAKFIIQILQEAGFEAYLVGGAVRDSLLAQQQQLDPLLVVKDYDFATNAKPAEIRRLFPESYYENEFGTVAITHQELIQQMGLKPSEVVLPSREKSDKNRIIDLAKATKIHQSLAQPEKNQADGEEKINWLPDFEITTYRSSEVYDDFRHPDPEKLVWGETIEQDLERRDFTINAIALKLKQNDECELIDPFAGHIDLKENLIKTVGEASERFGEDALRMLRAIRFSVQLNFTISKPTLRAITQHAGLMTKISWERIGEEFLKVISSNYPAEGIRLLDKTGLLKHVLPELLAAKGVQQGGHHTTDVWTHSLDALRECPNPDPVVRLATLLHDIAKPQTYEVREGKITFYNHEIVGSRFADEIAKRLHLSKIQRRRLFILVRHHMFYYQPHHTDAAIRRFMRKVGLENIDDILDLREADRLGSGARKTSWRLEEMKTRIIEQLNQPMDATDLAINGHDLMEKFQLPAGPWIGDALNQLLEQVLDNPDLNQKEELLQLAEELVKN